MNKKLALSATVCALALVSSSGTGAKADLPQSPMVAEPVARDEQGKLVVRPISLHGQNNQQTTCNITIPDTIRSIVTSLSKKHNVDVNLALAVIAVESNFKVNARSNKNAQGLMQLIPATAKRFGVDNIYDPHQNINGGMAYLSWLLGEFKGNVTYTLAGYNAGENSVHKYNGVPPYSETVDYVKKVTRIYSCL